MKCPNCNKINDKTNEKCGCGYQFVGYVEKLDPDIITGYNIFGFDFAFMWDRAEALGITEEFSKLGREKHQSKDEFLQPIFIVGFPRSGTTLLDTILRSHPSIEVIEEEPILANFISSLNKIINENFYNLKNIEENKLNEIMREINKMEKSHMDDEDAYQNLFPM